MAWNNIEFFETGESYYGAVMQAIHGALSSVLVEMYIFRCDETGKEILSALCLAQSRGVKVYVRVDGVGSREQLTALSEFCGARGLQLEVFHPLPFTPPGKWRPAGFARRDGLLMRWRMMNRRTHRKLVIVDEALAFAGGRNVDDVENERFSGTKAWHDLSVGLRGDSVATLVRAFWLEPFRRQPSRDFLLNYNWGLKRRRNAWFLRRLRRARRQFWVVTPYFAPTPPMLFQLRLAARRGVDVRLVLPAVTDVAISRLAARAVYRQLLGWGVRIFEFRPQVLHRKLWIVDDLSLIGSGNLNHRSFMHDLECDMILREPDAVAKSRELFLRDTAQSTEISQDDFGRLPWWKRVVYWSASWWIYWL